MHHIKPLHLCLSFIALICLTGFIQPALSQSQPSDFPHVASSESFYAYVGDVSFSISNNAQNIFTCGGFGESFRCHLWRRDIDEAITGLDSVEAYWSIDNSHLITMDKDYKCPSNTELYNLILFETQTGKLSRHCSSIPAWRDNWSPFQAHKLYMFHHLIDTDTFQETYFSSPPKLSTNDISRYWGYGGLFWNLNTALPVGEISLTVKDNLQSIITQSQLRICTRDGKDCQTLLDTLTVAPVDVFDYKLYKNWILWGGHLSRTGQALNIENRPDDIADTALYLTNFHTGVTQEIFRFSSLGQSNTYVNKIAWSPDEKSIALAIEELDSGLLPTLSLDGTPMPTPTYPPGIVLLHLVWPPDANTD